MNKFGILVLLFFFLLFSSCRVSQFRAPKQINPIAQGSIPYNQEFAGTPIGGISGVFKKKESEAYFLVSDDRSRYSPARFYTGGFRVDWANKTISFVPEKVNYLKNANQRSYPNFLENPKNSIDPEEIQWSGKRNELYVSNEGERLMKPKFIGQNPSIGVYDSLGNFKNNVVLPSFLKADKHKLGIRRNGSLEAMALTPKEDILFYATEVPLCEDGEEPTPQKGGLLRLVRHSLKSNKVETFVYPSEPISFAPVPEGTFGVNGLVAMLALSKTEFLAMERSYSNGRAACTIRIFYCNLKNADTLQANTNLQQLPNDFNTINKTLLYNLDDLNKHVDNLEGMTWGPIRPNGKRTLLLIADNNFSESQITQIFLFELN